MVLALGAYFLGRGLEYGTWECGEVLDQSLTGVDPPTRTTSSTMTAEEAATTTADYRRTLTAIGAFDRFADLAMAPARSLALMARAGTPLRSSVEVA